jgi:uncharacterized repeat protein (TIGR01451 family)
LTAFRRNQATGRREIVAKSICSSDTAQPAGRWRSANANLLTTMISVTEHLVRTGKYLFRFRINHDNRPGIAMKLTFPARRDTGECRIYTAEHSHRGGIFPAAFIAIVGIFLAGSAFAAGTDAGSEIQNTAQATFEVGGVAQTPVNSNSTQTFVDELIDVVVVSTDAGPVAVSSPDAGAVLQFSVTNTGNGTETFRLFTDTAVSGNDFSPTVLQLYLESNGQPGLQTGVGGDTAYLQTSNDPDLLEDESILVYVVSSIPDLLASNDTGALLLRAVSTTVINESGATAPGDAGFPVPGTAYVDAGDPDAAGTGNVTAVVGATFDPTNLLIQAQGSYVVSAAIVTITKTATNVVDPFGGATLVPGSVITYALEVEVSGSGSADSLVVTDIIPAELEYQVGTIAVSSLPAGEEVDDDFAPAGTDNTGFDAGSQTVTVSLGDVAGGTPVITITFDAAIR